MVRSERILRTRSEFEECVDFRVPIPGKTLAQCCPHHYLRRCYLESANRHVLMRHLIGFAWWTLLPWGIGVFVYALVLVASMVEPDQYHRLMGLFITHVFICFNFLGQSVLMSYRASELKARRSYLGLMQWGRWYWGVLLIINLCLVLAFFAIGNQPIAEAYRLPVGSLFFLNGLGVILGGLIFYLLTDYHFVLLQSFLSNHNYKKWPVISAIVFVFSYVGSVLMAVAVINATGQEFWGLIVMLIPVLVFLGGLMIRVKINLQILKAWVNFDELAVESIVLRDKVIESRSG